MAASKTFKRKRRIEFIKTFPNPPPTKNRKSYNFVPPVVDENSRVTSPSAPIETNVQGTDDQSAEEKREEISSSIDLLKSKLKFLVDGRPEVSPVQIITCQFEV